MELGPGGLEAWSMGNIERSTYLGMCIETAWRATRHQLTSSMLPITAGYDEHSDLSIRPLTPQAPYPNPRHGLSMGRMRRMKQVDDGGSGGLQRPWPGPARFKICQGHDIQQSYIHTARCWW